MKIKYNNSSVSWTYAGKNVEVTLDKVLHASFRENKNDMVIETGEEFVVEWVYYYTLAGVFLAKQHLETGEFTWYYNGKHQLFFPYTETVGFYPEQNLILLIYRISEERVATTAMKVFDLDGNLIREISSPDGYTMIYITEIVGEKVRVACEALEKENYDQYGRSRFHFNLDLNTKEWEKDGLAY